MKMSLHMIMTGEWLTKQAVDTYWGLGMIDDENRVGIATDYPNHDEGLKILDSLKPKLKKKQIEGIVNGDLKLIGATTCDDPKCRQCIKEEIKGIVVVETTREERVYLQDRIAMGEHKHLVEENARLEKQLMESEYRVLTLGGEKEELEEYIPRRKRKTEGKGFVKLGKWEVDEHLLESYAQAIRGMLKAMSPFSPTNNPRLGQKLFERRVKIHKKIFKSVNVPYLQDVHPLNHKRQYKESKKLYDLIEEWITKNHPDIDKKSRFDIERMKNND
jgi:hypothetical protein